MPKKKILIITSTFPFSPYDHFVESEIPSLNKFFDIDILPQNLTKPEGDIFHKTHAHLFNQHKGLLDNDLPKELLIPILFSFSTPLFLIKLLCSFLYEVLYLLKSELILILKIIRRKILGYSTPGLLIKRKVRDLLIATGLVLIFNHKLRHLNLKQYDVIYSYWGNELALAISFKASKKQMMSRFHGYDLYLERKASRYFPFRRYFFNHLGRAIFISQKGKDYILKGYTINKPQRLVVSYLGSNPPEPTLPLCQQNQSAPLTVLTCSTFKPVKQLEKLIEALALYPNPIHWHHLGGPADTPYAQSLLTMAKNTLRSPVSYSFHGYVKNDEIVKRMVEINPDLFINCSQSEGLPVAIMEAMSVNIPILAPKIGGIPEIILDGENGLLLEDSFTPMELAKALSEFNDLPLAKRQSMANQSYQEWKKNLNSEEQAKNFSQFCHDFSQNC